MAVDSSTGVFSIVGQVLELLGNAMVHAGDGGEVAVGRSGPGQSGRWLPLGSAACLEGAIPVGADGDVNDPGGSCRNRNRGGKVRQASKAGLPQNTWNELLVLVDPQRVISG